MVDVPLGFHEFRVLLRPAEPALRGAAKPDFTAIVSARDEVDALAEAEKVVETLNWAVSVVSIEPNPGLTDPDLDGLGFPSFGSAYQLTQ